MLFIFYCYIHILRLTCYGTCQFKQNTVQLRHMMQKRFFSTQKQTYHWSRKLTSVARDSLLHRSSSNMPTFAALKHRNFLLLILMVDSHISITYRYCGCYWNLICQLINKPLEKCHTCLFWMFNSVDLLGLWVAFANV